MAIEEEPDRGLPEWVVTFGDMMSLLLTFFIMLVSMSEIKEQERFQALVDSMQKQFGHDMSDASRAPGTHRPRNSRLAKLATQGRAKRANTMNGGDKVKAPVGEHPRVRVVRPGDQRTIGGVVFFADGIGDLTDENRHQLRMAAEVMVGKSQKIEVRGHTSRKPLAADSPYRDHWELAYTRSRQTAEFLISLGIDHRRIRISVAAETEPLDIGDDPQRLKENDRVEVFLLNEVTRDLEGSPARDPQT